MGYYTRYCLLIKEVDADTVDAIRDWLIAADVANYALDPDYTYDNQGGALFDTTGSAVKWYAYREDMFRLSKAFPNVTFLLRGNGEDMHDVWAEVYLNGDSEGHYLTIPEFERIPW